MPIEPEDVIVPPVNGEEAVSEVRVPRFEVRQVLLNAIQPAVTFTPYAKVEVADVDVEI